MSTDPLPKALFQHIRYDGDDLEMRAPFMAARAQGQIGQHRTKEATHVPDLEGMTICKLVDETGAVVSTGYSFCSANDQFCRRTGRLIAEGRARRAARGR